ncbi:MAG: STAS domain-containing protein [Ruminococcaceae bacterium]|nr:STAS domain-containing protein [Oscillospiraceae bacterium]
MGAKIEITEDTMTVKLSGDIDHHTAGEIRRYIDERVQIMKPGVLKMDFADVPFMDSSGIGLILGRVRLMKIWNGRVVLMNISESISRMAKMAGVFNFATVERKINEQVKGRSGK